MISNEFVLELIIKTLQDLNYGDISDQLLTTIRQQQQQQQQSATTVTASTPEYSQIIDWFFTGLKSGDYDSLNKYLTSIINNEHSESDEFIALLNYQGSNVKSLLVLILYLIRRIQFLDTIFNTTTTTTTPGNIPSIDDKLQFLSTSLIPLLDEISIDAEFSHCFDYQILQQLNRQQESSLLLGLVQDKPILNSKYLFGYKLDEDDTVGKNNLGMFPQLLFKDLFVMNQQSIFNQVSRIPKNYLHTLIEQAIKYQQSQFPNYLPPRTLQEKRKINQHEVLSLPLDVENFQGTRFSNNGQLLHTLNQHTNEVWFVKFSPSGRFLVSGSLDGKLILYDVLDNFKLIKILEPTTAADNSAFIPLSTRPNSNGKKKAVIYCCWDPNEQYIVSCCLDTVVRIWSVAGIHHNKKRITRSTSVGSGSAIDPMSDNAFKLIVCFTLGQDIKTWTCEFLPEIKPTGKIESNESPQFIIGSPDKVLKAYNCEGVELFDFYGNIEDEDEDEDDEDEDGMMLQHEDSMKEDSSLSLQQQAAKKDDDVTMQPVDEATDSSSQHNNNNVANTSNSIKKTLESNFNRINDLTITPDGKMLITANNDKQLHFYKIPDVLNEDSTTRRIASINLKGRLTSCSISKNGKYLLLSSAPEELQVWNISIMPPVLYHKYIGHSQSTYIVRSSFGYLNEETEEEELVLSGSDDGYVYFWKLHSGALISRIKAHNGLCNCVDWNSNGGFVGGKDFGKLWASAGDDKLVKVWGV
ncbi:uncharacterized protein J8A68_005846 [[Candida] subhashii]|uniref:Uncharacterized protein n=1 Tax=[Candida] subhashii TaxID=561895 RepID=A0A8J5QL92_9ASCO|nr:uncharacterized protein J8A68_005846 [[Candida] subhashii]KAG7660580.1 hypothetical protein J8A68_005846 [[Candida] subhashii]